MSISSMMLASRSEDNVKEKTPSNKVIIITVYISLLLDNILLTVVVPIIPDYLYNLEHNGTTSVTRIYCNQTCSISNDRGRVRPLSELEPDTSAQKRVSDRNATYLWRNGTVTTHCDCPSSEVLSNYYIPEDIINENAKVGLLFSSKALVQLVTNCFIGTVIQRFGYSLPLFLGNFCLLVSSTVFAYSSTYGMFFVARSLQGIGSACIAVSGLGLIADRYTDDATRSKVMGAAMGGIAMGVLVGYPLGGVLYDFVGKTAPFLIITIISLVNGAFQIYALDLTITSANCKTVGTPSFTILRNPNVLIIIGAIWVSTSAMAVLEPCLPIWLMDTITPEKWQLGTVFIPDSIGYFVGTTFFGIVALKVGRWLIAALSLVLVGISAMLVTTATHMTHLIVPHFLLGYGIGVIDSALMPLLAYIFDNQCLVEYGSVYAIAQGAVSLAYFVGPLVGSQVVKQIGFPWLMTTVGIINVLYSPLCLFLRRLTPHEESRMPGLCSIIKTQIYRKEFNPIMQ